MPLSDAVSIPLPYTSPKTYTNLTKGGPGTQLGAVVTRPRMRIIATVDGTNLLLWTDNLSRIEWEKHAGLTIASSSIATPDPGRTATVVTTTGAGLLLDQTVPVDILNTETAWFSVWMKTPVDPKPVDLRIYQVWDGVVDVVSFTVTTSWTHYIMSRTFTVNSAMKIGIVPQFTGDLHIFGPQVVDNVSNIIRYIPSLDIPGEHITYRSVARFMMTENPTSTIGLMSESAGDYPVMMESV